MQWRMIAMTKNFLLIPVLAILCVGLSAHAPAAEIATTLTDEAEVRIGKMLAKQFEQEEGMQSTPQTKKLDQYLQTVGDRVAAFAQRKLPYEFHFDPSPGFKSAVG